MHHLTLPSPLGPLRLLASATHLLRIDFQLSPVAPPLPDAARGTTPATDHPVLADAITQLDEYFQRARQTFDLPLQPHPAGTDFQQRVWGQLRRIPFGQTATYQQIAARLQNPKAARAVGLANRHNPLSIVVPCHRVLGTNRTLTGFAGGLPNKQKLLDLEAQTLFSTPPTPSPVRN